jgi:hypothetical protein
LKLEGDGACKGNRGEKIGFEGNIKALQRKGAVREKERGIIVLKLRMGIRGFSEVDKKRC